MTFIERATTLGYMPIDALVEVGSDEDMRRLVATLAPDLRVQGAEYAGHATRFPHVCRCFVPDTGLHTSDIIARIRQQS
jgi:bifunctional ADP-heptose synthase (sugar kinase/adenylyltransferase)